MKIAQSKSIMLRRMTGSVIGSWIAHGEGRFSFKTDAIRERVARTECVSLHYVNDDGEATEVYPMNPNGSVDGTAGLCSLDGRHLAMMPHPERCSQMWQWPYVSPGFNFKRSPWQTMFDEAYKWCADETAGTV